MRSTTAMRSSDFEDFLLASCLEDTVFPPTTFTDPSIEAQKTTRSRSQNDYEAQSGSAQVRSTPGTTSNTERESPDVEYSEADKGIGNTDFGIFDQNIEKLARSGKKRSFWDDIMEGSGQSSSTFGVRENHDKFKKPQATGRLSNYAMTSQLNLALEYIGQAISEIVDLPDDAFSSVHRQLVKSQNTINHVVRCWEDEEDIEAEIPFLDSIEAAIFEKHYFWNLLKLFEI